MAPTVFSTAADYFNAVNQCEERVLEAVRTPGVNFVPLMTSMQQSIASIFETCRTNALGPAVTRKTSFLHHFVVKYMVAKRDGVLNEEFRANMLALSNSDSADPNEAGKVERAKNPAPVETPAAVKKPAPVQKPTAVEKPAPVQKPATKPVPSSNISGSTNNTPKHCTLSHVSPPARSSTQKPTQRQDNSSRVTTVAMQLAAKQAEAKEQGSDTGARKGKGKGKQGLDKATGKRKRDSEQGRTRADKSAYRGAGVYYQIPCDHCAKGERLCEKRAGHRGVKKGTASCLSCARSSRKCTREGHPECDENKMVLTDAAGAIVTHLIRAPRHTPDAEETDEDNVSEDPQPPRKKSKTKSAEYVDDSDMNVDPVEDGPQEANPQPVPAKKQSKQNRHVCFGKVAPKPVAPRPASSVPVPDKQAEKPASPAPELGTQAPKPTTVPPVVASSVVNPTLPEPNHQETSAPLASTMVASLPHPVPTPAALRLPFQGDRTPSPATVVAPGYRRFSLPPVVYMEGVDGVPSVPPPPPRNESTGSTVWARLARLPTTIPEIYAARNPQIGPKAPTIQALAAQQKVADKSIVAILCRLNDVAMFVESIQVERYRNYELLASRDDAYRHRQFYIDAQLSAYKDAIIDLEKRHDALEADMERVKEYLVEQVEEIERANSEQAGNEQATGNEQPTGNEQENGDGLPAGIEAVEGSPLAEEQELPKENPLDVACIRIAELENHNEDLSGRVAVLERALAAESQRNTEVQLLEQRLQSLEALLLKTSAPASMPVQVLPPPLPVQCTSAPVPMDIDPVPVPQRLPRSASVPLSNAGPAKPFTGFLSSKGRDDPISMQLGPQHALQETVQKTGSSGPLHTLTSPAQIKSFSILPVSSAPSQTPLPAVEAQVHQLPPTPGIVTTPLPPVPQVMLTHSTPVKETVESESEGPNHDKVVGLDSSKLPSLATHLRASSISAQTAAQTQANSERRRSPRFQPQQDEEQVDFED
ncbi:hypothetical protein CPC08DRAFT_759752 [Agrocybe pediades]|nr:hypothetical protein CPC08DRAFT_759752 [Agrocybe pediades]